MITKELNGNGKIVIARAKIYAPHLGEVLAFSLPMKGPDYFKNVMNAIDKCNGLRPTTAQTLSLVDLALKNSDEEHCKDILSKLGDNYFWTATENLWGRKDVIVYDNVDGKMPSGRKSLIKRHKDGDKAVRIVPYGFQTNKQSVDELLKNPYVIAQVGDKDMLDVVKRVAEGVNRSIHSVWASCSAQKVKGHTALFSYWHGDMLCLSGYFVSSTNSGYASRVRNASTEGVSAVKN